MGMRAEPAPLIGLYRKGGNDGTGYESSYVPCFIGGHCCNRIGYPQYV